METEDQKNREAICFQTLENFGLARLHAYYKECDFDICEYSVGIKRMCESLYGYCFAEACGCLLCRDEYEGIVYFDFPVAKEGGDVAGAMRAIEAYCVENEIPLRYTTLPPSALALVGSVYDGMRLRKTYDCREYCYRKEEILSFAGKHYAGQRNHVRRFWREHPQARFRALSREDLPAVERFFARYAAQSDGETAAESQERKESLSLLLLEREDIFRAGCMELEGEIIGIALGEKCGNTLFEHIEKALFASYHGIYPAMFQAFVSMYAKDCTHVSREDDAGDVGLRISKLQYHPTHISQKYDADILNLLSFLECEPCIRSARLTIDALCEEDKDAYAALCLDDAHNRYWGYDYREDTSVSHYDADYFLRTVREDFQKRTVMSLAVRLGNTFIGEIVFHRPDYRGSIEIGVRIAPAHAGRGYGKEAVEAAAEWAIYTLGAERVCARCYRENAPSVAIFSKLMRRVAEDEEMIYFEKNA